MSNENLYSIHARCKNDDGETVELRQQEEPGSAPAGYYYIAVDGLPMPGGMVRATPDLDTACVWFADFCEHIDTD